MKMRVKIVFLLIIPASLFAQVMDDFSDGDFTHDPTWFGTAGTFSVNEDFVLQLQDEDADISWLVTDSWDGSPTEWRFKVQLKFSPSGNNFCRVYLSSDHPDLSQPLKGYFLQLGEPGADDAPELFRQVNDTLIPLCRGTEGMIASSFTAGFKITYREGLWTLYADPQGGDYYLKEAEAYEPGYSPQNYLGLYCQYTMSNSKKFYFDDFYMGPCIVDSIPPEIIRISPLSANSLAIAFSEYLDGPSACDPSAYQLDHGHGNPSTACLSSGDPGSVITAWNEPFENGTSYHLQVSGVKDLAGNCMDPVTLPFTHYRPGPYDIIISEIMADPVPSQGLPEYEYLELHNTTNHDILMKGWSLVLGDDTREIPEITVPSSGYCILCKEGHEEYFTSYGNCAGIYGFSLRNAGALIRLGDDKGNTIHCLEYSLAWYGDETKQEGGYSLEIMDPSNPCAFQENWGASRSITGGTPGEANSLNTLADIPVRTTKTCAFSDSSCVVFFNQSLHETARDTASFILLSTQTQPRRVQFHDAFHTALRLDFATAFERGNAYELLVRAGISNCNGSAVTEELIVPVGTPEDAFDQDVIINEILFEPAGGCDEYVELYNNSVHIVDLQGYTLSTIRISWPDPADTVTALLSGGCYLLFPGDHVAFTRDPSTVIRHFDPPDRDKLRRCVDMPQLPNTSGTILIRDANGFPMDNVEYNQSMHFPLLNLTRGVALERIDPAGRSADPTNWHSASQTSGFGTPAERNSQYNPGTGSEDPVRVEPAVFYPGSYGEQSTVRISFRFDKPGYTASIFIFDDRGYLTRKLAENMLMGTEERIFWDGISASGTLVSSGIYIIHAEVFNQEGKVKRFRQAIVAQAR
ncbi:MAG: lamin tail domain-containing protein [Bacteroidales bacterium]